MTTAPILTVVVALATTAAHAEARSNGQQPGLCADRTPSIVIETRRGKLWLCGPRKPSVPAMFRVVIGLKGAGKQRTGDWKTPVGSYRLGKPRRSAKYHLFIPIAYPTQKQRRAGYTGSAIGIHGPPRWSAWAGRLNTIFGWTAGCIAVGSDEEISTIAAWVRRERIRVVHILD